MDLPDVRGLPRGLLSGDRLPTLLSAHLARPVSTLAAGDLAPDLTGIPAVEPRISYGEPLFLQGDAEDLREYLLNLVARIDSL